MDYCPPLHVLTLTLRCGGAFWHTFERRFELRLVPAHPAGVFVLAERACVGLGHQTMVRASSTLDWTFIERIAGILLEFREFFRDAVATEYQPGKDSNTRISSFPLLCFNPMANTINTNAHCCFTLCSVPLPLCPLPL